MPADLRSITHFDDLITYLGEELDWPVADYPLEDLTFEYDADELGLKDEEAEKLKDGTIRQLRPLPGGQPFGIFFVEFGLAKLPVVVLRRILNALVVKKRNSANPADRQRWDAADLLFISAFGEDDEREIAFAHFHKDPDTTELPVLRVLGWDGSDTTLKTKYVAEVLKNRLHWPANPKDQEAWRKQWRGAFRHRLGHVIRTSSELADAIAGFARKIRDAAITIMAHESDARGQLRKLHKAFQSSLVSDLTEADFADTYAQTVTYGLLTAAISKTPPDADAMAPGEQTALTQDDITAMVPVTNPFLKEMLQEFLKVGGRSGGVDFDELGINEVVELLRGDETDLPAILRDFGKRQPGEDPVIHFYETFLKAYNKKLRIQRGVFYTPQPVVGYIVRSVHELLQSEFGLEHGLADTTTWGEFIQKSKINNPQSEIQLPTTFDGKNQEHPISEDEPFVQILDPATGTATFLVEVIDVIYKHLKERWKIGGLAAMPPIKNSKSNIQHWSDYWNEYVPKALLPRLHAYELMMAPYAIAHMKIGLKLAETGYRFDSEERVRIYLTNALEKADDKQVKLIGFDALAHEAEAVSKIKKSKRFTVIIGNPPYANYSANLTTKARRIVDKYRSFRGIPIRERNQLQFERNIQDDFVKFISIAQDIVDTTGVGMLGYITNGTMLASTSLRGMRENLARDFNRLFELNLHGGGNEIIVGSEDDENVFDIVQSVAIHVYVRSMKGGASVVNHADLLGRRPLKYSTLASRSVTDTEWRQIEPDSENCGFTPQDEAGGGSNRRLDSAFVKFGAGIKTNRDAIVVAFDDRSLLETVREFDSKLVAAKHAQDNIHSLLYRPFDVRRIFYHEDVVASRSLPTMKHIIAGPNIGFICSSTWTTPDRFSVGVSRLMVEMKTGTHDRGTTFFPIYRYESLLGGNVEKVHNLTPNFVKEWCVTTGTKFVQTGQGDGEITTGPEDVLLWLFSLFFSPEYRRRYRSGLSQRFPIVFLPSNLELFRELARLGGGWSHYICWSLRMRNTPVPQNPPATTGVSLLLISSAVTPSFQKSVGPPMMAGLSGSTKGRPAASAPCPRKSGTSTLAAIRCVRSGSRTAARRKASPAARSAPKTSPTTTRSSSPSPKPSA